LTEKMTNRLPLDPPKQWGLTDDELAAWPLSFKDDALAGKVCFGETVTAKAMTIRDPEQVQALFAETWQRFGRLDVLVNSAGGQFPQAAIDFSVKGWNAVIDTNLNGTWYMMQSAAQHWRDRQAAGSIVNIVAVVNRGMPQVAHTAAARAGVIYLSKTLSVEWAPLGIRINCVAPGSIATDGLNVYPREAAEGFVLSNPDEAPRRCDGHCPGRRLPGGADR
jgi:NAD(P)-dependent dehydrogenase (short-subunit alcohol dehydrogenase family)